MLILAQGLEPRLLQLPLVGHRRHRLHATCPRGVARHRLQRRYTLQHIGPRCTPQARVAAKLLRRCRRHQQLRQTRHQPPNDDAKYESNNTKIPPRPVRIQLAAPALIGLCSKCNRQLREEGYQGKRPEEYSPGPRPSARSSSLAPSARSNQAHLRKEWWRDPRGVYSPLVAAMAATALAAIAAAIAPSVSWLRAIVRKTRVCNCWWRHWQERTHLNLNCLGLLLAVARVWRGWYCGPSKLIAMEFEK